MDPIDRYGIRQVIPQKPKPKESLRKRWDKQSIGIGRSLGM